MSAPSPAGMTEEAAKALRSAFDPAQIGKLPKAGTTLDYVGHAAVTDRLLSVDPEWSWEPVAFDVDGAPLIRFGARDASMWIRLTICGVTRLGVGIVGVSAFELEKQLISDALRNAAMRFGVALDLWTKQDLHDMANPEALPEPPMATGELPVGNVDAMGFRELNDALRVAGLPLGGTVPVMRERLKEAIAGSGEPDIQGDGPAVGDPSEARAESVIGATEPATASPDPSEPTGYDAPAWTKAILAAQCQRLELPYSGNRERLIGELRAYNALNRPEFVEFDDPDLEPF